MSRLAPLALVLALVALPAVARAEPPPGPTDAWKTAPFTRRGGFYLGVELGFGMASIAGFPNDPLKIERQSYYTATGFRPSGLTTIWLGGALTDWFAVGLGASFGPVFGLPGGESATVGAFAFRVEAFPLFNLGSVFRDLGAYGEAGTGTVAIVPPTKGANLIVDGGSTSFLGGGVFYEGIRFWRIGMGPAAEANYMWSDSARRPGFYLGWRTAFYAGTFKL